MKQFHYYIFLRKEEERKQSKPYRHVAKHNTSVWRSYEKPPTPSDVSNKVNVPPAVHPPTPPVFCILPILWIGSKICVSYGDFYFLPSNNNDSTILGGPGVSEAWQRNEEWKKTLGNMYLLYKLLVKGKDPKNLLISYLSGDGSVRIKVWGR